MWDGVERRQFPRAEYPCLVTVRREGQPPQAVLTHTENISVGGVRVIIGEKINVETKVGLEIDLQDTEPNLASGGKIAWVKKVLGLKKPASETVEIRHLKGTVSWSKEIPPTEDGQPTNYDTGIQFTELKTEDYQRVENIVNRILGGL